MAARRGGRRGRPDPRFPLAVQRPGGRRRRGGQQDRRAGKRDRPAEARERKPALACPGRRRFSCRSRADRLHRGIPRHGLQKQPAGPPSRRGRTARPHRRQHRGPLRPARPRLPPASLGVHGAADRRRPLRAAACRDQIGRRAVLVRRAERRGVGDRPLRPASRARPGRTDPRARPDSPPPALPARPRLARR